MSLDAKTQSIFLQNISKKYNDLIKQIPDEVIQRIYSLFDFHSLFFQHINQKLSLDKENTAIKDFLVNELQYFNFIIYSIYNIKYSNEFREKPDIIDVVICVENQCIIIEEICYSIIRDLFHHLKEKNRKILNISTEYVDNDKIIEEDQAKEEISSFCSNFLISIKNFKLIKDTISPIAGYLIRRYYCPTEFFKDPSFFDFDKTNINERSVRLEFYNLINNISFDPTQFSPIIGRIDDIYRKNNYRNFVKDEFICLRKIYVNSNASYDLVIHKESLYIFALKKILNTDKNKGFQKEKNFCENYFHRCFIHFYGFLISDNEEIIGFVYEFMSNDTIGSYVFKNKNVDNSLFFSIIFRILQGIYYLHSHSLIHRDLHPLNILLDHDFIPYISDFETIRHPVDENSNEEITNDIGTLVYASPEQHQGEFVTYSTDIFSFGKIFYFLMKPPYYLNEEEEEEFEYSLSKDFLKFYKRCIDIKAENRFTIKQINSDIYSKLIEKNLYWLTFEIDEIYIKNQYPYEIFIFQNGSIEKRMYFIYNFYFQLFYHEKSKFANYIDKFLEHDYITAIEYYKNFLSKQDHMDFMYDIAVYYCYHEHNYKEGMKYYEISAKFNNLKSFEELGELYYYGQGVDKNYIKAREYFELAAKQNSVKALKLLAQMYINGDGVEKNLLKAIEIYEYLAKEKLYFFSYSKLGELYWSINFSKAIECFELGTELFDPYSFEALGFLRYYGIEIEKNYDMAREYFEKASCFEQPFAFIKLADIYYFGNGVKEDYLKAKKLYEDSIDLMNYSDAYVKIGNLYLKGKDVRQDYSKAKEYYELAANQNNSDALYKLGKLYYKGLGVKKDYLKAKKYFELSSIQGYSKASFMLGYFYLNGIGIQKDIKKAILYYEISLYRENPNAYYILGDLNSCGDVLDVDIKKAILYFLRGANIQYGENIILSNKISFSKKTIFNYYKYQSMNDVGLIFILQFGDIKEGVKYIKEAAFAEYPFGQNNFGLINEFYYHKFEYAKYMYERSSSNNFPLAYFNLGQIAELHQKREESINYYIKASENEDKPLIFHNRQHYDKRLEVSKAFIICFTNLKLANYYLSKSNFEESKKYFLKVFSKLEINSENTKHVFKLKVPADNIKYIFTYIKHFILNCPLFNLLNQPNVYLLIKSELNDSFNTKNQQVNNNNDVQSTTKNVIYSMMDNESEHVDDFDKCMRDEVKYIDTKEIINNVEKIVNEEEIMFNDFNELFNFLISSQSNKEIFLSEINKIIQIMEKIIYTRPYIILFGRIVIEDRNAKSQKKNFPRLVNINEKFYEGFGIEL